jgi:hypothetical protein
MRQRHSHPPFVVKIDAGCEIEEIQIVLGVSVAGLHHCIDRERFLATSAFSVTNRGTKQSAGILMFIN